MKFSVVNCDQRSEQWFSARAGRLTSSCADVIFMHGKKKGEESVTKRDLRIRLALEQLTGKSLDDGYSGRFMDYGTKREPDAIIAYEKRADVMVREVGFLSLDGLMAGCSPDGVIGECKGGIEVKCPKPATHLGYLRSKDVPADYLPQMTHQLWISGAEWWDFVSFDDRLPEGPAQLCIRRLWRKDVDLQAHELAVRLFLSEVEKERDDIAALSQAAA